MNIQFSFVLDTEIPTDGQLYAYNNGYIEGSLEIYLNEKLFFQEPGVNLAECGIELGKWVKQVQGGPRQDMIYETIDHDEAIIEFLYSGEEKWKICSIWQVFESNEYASTASLFHSVKRYLRQLNDELHEIEYVTTLDEYL